MRTEALGKGELVCESAVVEGELEGLVYDGAGVEAVL